MIGESHFLRKKSHPGYGNSKENLRSIRDYLRFSLLFYYGDFTSAGIRGHSLFAYWSRYGLFSLDNLLGIRLFKELIFIRKKSCSGWHLTIT